MKILKNVFREWLSLASHWQNLKPLFSVVIVRLFVTWFALTPILVKALEGLPEHLEVLIGDKSYIIVMDLPFTWWVLWAASLCFFLAYLLFVARCPRFVKSYSGYSEFQAAGHSPRWLVWELYYSWSGTDRQTRLAERLIEKELALELSEGEEPLEKPVVQKRGTVWRFGWGDKVYEACIASDASSDDQQEYFWEIFGSWSGSRTVSRHLIWLLISLSAILVFSVVVEHILFTLKYIFS